MLLAEGETSTLPRLSTVKYLKLAVGTRLFGRNPAALRDIMWHRAFWGNIFFRMLLQNFPIFLIFHRFPRRALRVFWPKVVVVTWRSLYFYSIVIAWYTKLHFMFPRFLYIPLLYTIVTIDEFTALEAKKAQVDQKKRPRAGINERDLEWQDRTPPASSVYP